MLVYLNYVIILHVPLFQRMVSSFTRTFCLCSLVGIANKFPKAAWAHISLQSIIIR